MLALWFLGLMDTRWRAAEVSKEGVNSAGELKSSGGSDVVDLEVTEGHGGCKGG